MRNTNFARRIICSFSSIPNEKMIVILSHSNNLSNYTFLGIQLTAIDSTFASISSQLDSLPLSVFMKAFNQHRYAVKQIQSNQYSYRDLRLMDNSESKICETLGKHRQQLIDLKNKYQLLCKFIPEKVNKQSLLLWLEVCLKLNITESTIWSKLFSIIIKNFSKFCFKERALIIKYTHSYIKNKFIAFTHAPSKFVYRENYLVDLTNFRVLLKIYAKAVVKAEISELSLKAECLQMLNYFLEKISKIYVLNFSEMIGIYNTNRSNFDELAENGSIETLVDILKFLSIIGLYDQQYYESIQAKILQKWKNEKNQSNDAMVYLINGLLSTWANIHHHNQEIFKTIAKPFIQKQINSGTQSRRHSVWLFNIVASDVKDIQFIERFRNKVVNDNPLSNKYIHISTHYLAILENSKLIDAYPTCSQHPLTTKILKNKGPHLNCMERQKETKSTSHQHMTALNEAGKEENPPEHFWLSLAQKAFNIVRKRYPHPENSLHLNYSFCVFQLDAMMMINGVPVAFELGGSHYYLKGGQNNILTSQAQGKKVIKYKILRSYGIQLLQLNSTNVIEKNISSQKDVEGGVQYIVQKLEQILKNIQ